MSNNTALRLFRPLQSSICASCRSGLRTPTHSALRPLSTSTSVLAVKKPLEIDSVLSKVDENYRRQGGQYGSVIPDRNSLHGLPGNLVKQEWEEEERHHLHIYAHKHNTHLTLTKPNRDALISVSCGNIGFRKAARGSYDAAYQLTAFVMSRIQDKGLLPQIQRLELVYRGFGDGREAVTKAILGTEGRKIRHLIVKLADSTRLKFGGTRSKKPRRLG
ncbi:mitochondrial ribosomal protein subunit S18 [Dendryphion nanum]|uniref:Small ribosomal subunit protein uS11m n=1 Tax=Dendryphion nanum TaxID=256645 RepID=A0A9P9D8C8_9PLEO|nr:mitochondrial ribosomal protein subunit S18 [Dendryphion nanum]